MPESNCSRELLVTFGGPKVTQIIHKKAKTLNELIHCTISNKQPVNFRRSRNESGMTLSGDIAGKIKKSNLWMLRESFKGDPFRQPADRDDCFCGIFNCPFDMVYALKVYAIGDALAGFLWDSQK